MTKTLTLNPVTVSIGWDYEQTGFPGNSKDINGQSYASSTLNNGTAAGQANVKYSAQLAIAANGNTTLDLTNLTDNFGNAISFARIKDMYIENSSVDSASAIKVGGAVSNAFTGMWSAPGTANNDSYLTINNGVCFHMGVDAGATGYPVGTDKNILITNLDGSNAALVNIVIVGCNA